MLSSPSLFPSEATDRSIQAFQSSNYTEVTNWSFRWWFSSVSQETECTVVAQSLFFNQASSQQFIKAFCYSTLRQRNGAWFSTWLSDASAVRCACGVYRLCSGTLWCSKKNGLPLNSIEWCALFVLRYGLLLLGKSQEQTTNSIRSDILLYFSQIQRLLLRSEICSVSVILHSFIVL